jgi:hypothetical protein
MAEWIPAQIRIGGELTPEVLEGLWEAIEAEGCGPEWTEGFASKEAFIHHLIYLDGMARAGRPGPLLLQDDQARWGKFEGLEAFCRAHALTYVRDCEAKYEYDAEVVWWAPGMEEAQGTTGTQDGGALVSIEALRAALAQGEPAAQLAAVRKLVDERTPVTVPPITLSITRLAGPRRRLA